MHLFGVPAVMLVKGVFRVFVGRLIELFVFGRTKPGPMYDLALRPVRQRQIRQMRQPAMADGGFQNEAQRDDLIVERAARRRFVNRRLVGGCFDPTFLLLRLRWHETRGIPRVCNVVVDLWC
jgi:hypothetical protein